MRQIHGGVLIAVALLAPLLVLGSLWLPVIKHYHRAAPRLDATTVQQLRADADAGLLSELIRHRLIEHKSRPTESQVLSVADGILQGRLALPGHSPIRIGLPFDGRDLEQDSGRLQLRLAGLIVPDYLLQAYRLTGDERYLAQARETIVAWQRYERRARLPRGSMWDRNAITARVLVLTRFWSHYHDRADFLDSDAVAFFEGVQREAALLQKDSHYGYWNNQGIAQNVALLHLAVAFPGLPEAEAYRRTAVARLSEHLDYHVTDEGVLQEHSAGYHAKVSAVLALALRYMTLLEVPIPDQWRHKYSEARRFYNSLKRPDGTLPMFGDTENRPYPELMGTRFDASGRALPLMRMPDEPPAAADGLWPLSGYAVWWHGLAQWPHGDDLSQTAVVWANFAGKAHKHADELSVLFWTPAGTWWTNVGYLSPGGNSRLTQARSWSGSNAPFAVGSAADERRVSALRYAGRSKAIAALDLERRHQDGFTARRQILRYGSDLCLVLDHTTDSQARDARQIWTVALDVQVTAGMADGGFRLTRDNEDFLPVLVAGADGFVVRQAYGDGEPFAGWVIDASRFLVPTDALTVTAPAGGWTAVAWAPRAGASEHFTAPAQMQRWAGPEDWQLHLDLNGRRLMIRRNGTVLSADGGSEGPAQLDLRQIPDVSSQADALTEGLNSAARRYRGFKAYLPYRRKISGLLAAALVVQALAVGVFLRRHPLSGGRGILTVLIATVWAAIGGWLNTVYF